MASRTIRFANYDTGKIKEAPFGFSWTVLFFGFFSPIVRGDWKWGVIIFISGVITIGLSNIIFSFIYNTLYMKLLISNDFKLYDNSFSGDEFNNLIKCLGNEIAAQALQ